MREDRRTGAGATAHCHLNRKNLIVDGALYGWTVMRRGERTAAAAAAI